MNECVAVIIVVTASFAITAQSASTCNDPSDCDHHEVPPKRGRTCRVHESQYGYIEVKVNAGTLDSPASNCQAMEVLDSVCLGYVGMSMSLWCNFEEEVAIYKDGVPLTGGTNVTYSSLQREHQGLYQCVQLVNGSNEVVSEFNMTVQSEIHIGGDEERCPPFFCHHFRGEKCCRQHWAPYTATSDRLKNPYRLIVYGDEPIEVTHEQEWVTNYTLHYPTDMEVFVTRDVNDSRALDVNYYYSPYIINSGDLEVDFRITASNNFSSFSTCITVHFSGSDINWNANTSLPRGTNAALGDDAVFTCEFGGPRNFNAAPHLNFELSLPDVDGENYTTLTTICRDWTECDKWSPANHSVGVSIQSVQISDQNDYYGEQYRYNIRLAAVMTHHNGSIFSCSLSEHQSKSTDYFNGKDVIQWKGSAQLFVHEADTATIPVSAAETSQKLVAPVSAVVVVIVLISSAVITVLLLAAVKFFKKKRRSLCHGLVATDTIPLAAGQSCKSASQSTLNSDDGSIVATIPSIAEISLHTERQV